MDVNWNKAACLTLFEVLYFHPSKEENVIRNSAFRGYVGLTSLVIACQILETF